MQQRQVTDSLEIHFRRLLSFIAIAAKLLVTPLGIAQSEQALSHLDEPIQIRTGRLQRTYDGVLETKSMTWPAELLPSTKLTVLIERASKATQINARESLVKNHDE